ncbi:unnamed protein product [Orchesella dallaii]|uniref:C2H2-type domain-containing protein n=1 Tax=Orchesella dallaii TaxID=48710 RepID=A0ABP1Q1M7_9HEXA
MVSMYARDCSICQNGFKTRKAWLRHLLLPQHQKDARKGCSSWTSKVKKRIVVAISNVPIATKRGLYSFTKVIGRSNNVKEFIWSESQPGVGLFKFGKKATVNEIMERFGERELKWNENHSLQLKKATDLTEMEWEDLLREVQEGTATGCNSELDSDDDVEWNKRTPCAIADDETRCHAGSHSVDIETSSENCVVDDDDEEESVYETCPSSSMSDFRATATYDDDDDDEKPCLYRQQFDEIVNEIGIPDKDYQLALNVMKKCERIFAEKFPVCKFYMFRHWYLKLRNNGTNELLFYVDFDGALAGSNPHNKLYDMEDSFSLQQEQVEKIFASKAGRKILAGVEAVEKRQADHEPRAFQFEHKPSGLKFSIVADSQFRTEAQTSRLVNFLLDCDPRARPLMTLIFYWANKCNVVISQSGFKFSRLTHAFAPQPASLEWMVLLFLANKDIIPSPRQVLRRLHEKVVIFENIDIGFSLKKWKRPEFLSRPNIPHENSNEFFICLIKLARDFFNFYIELRTGSWILNTRDGEVLRKAELLTSKVPYKDRETLLRKEEIGKIRKSREHWEKRAIVMLHPLVCHWNIMVNLEAFSNGTDFKMACSVVLINLALEREDKASSEDFSLANLFKPQTIKKLTRIVLWLPFAPENVISKIEKRVHRLKLKLEPIVRKRHGKILRKLSLLRKKSRGMINRSNAKKKRSNTKKNRRNAQKNSCNRKKNIICIVLD